MESIKQERTELEKELANVKAIKDELSKELADIKQLKDELSKQFLNCPIQDFWFPYIIN